MTDVDAELGEMLYDGEQAAARRIAAEIGAQIERQYPPGVRPARRDAHPKAHGCVRAEFTVVDGLAPRFAKGLFVPGARYATWIRFSNGNGDPARTDARGDSHGMAIKLLGVPGKKVLESEENDTTHDFLLIDHPVFVIDDPARYLTLIRRTNSPRLLDKMLAPFAMGIRGALNALSISTTRIGNLLEARYWSATAYRLGVGAGREAVKYSVKPLRSRTSSIPSDPSPNFLRARLIDELAAGDVAFDFMVQPRADPSMSVERSTIEWKEEEAPFFKVANLTIPRQRFASPTQDAFGEQLSFTPWHALPEHRPLGAVNRVRRIVYEEVSRLRHAMNGVPRAEPTGNEAFE